LTAICNGDFVAEERDVPCPWEKGNLPGGVLFFIFTRNKCFYATREHNNDMIINLSKSLWCIVEKQ
jgi:hypothetical protein